MKKIKKKNMKKMLFSILIIFIDQLSKFFVVKYLTKLTIIDGFFYLDYASNTGAAFSIMKGNTIFLSIVSFVLILYLLRQMCNDYDKINTLSLILILGGAFGNLIDRIFRGFVVDFLSFKIFGYYFPIFNIADICITIGVIIMVIDIIKGDIDENRRRKRGKKA